MKTRSEHIAGGIGMEEKVKNLLMEVKPWNIEKFR